MNLLCLIGLLAGVWLFNQAVTEEELLSDTPAESRDFIDSLHWPAILALIESLSWIRKGNTPSLKATAGSPAWTQTICQLKRKMKVFPKASTTLDLSSRSITPTSTYPGWHTRNACEVFDWRFHVDLIIKSDIIWKLITPSSTVATTSLLQSHTSEIFTSQKLRDILFFPFFPKTTSEKFCLLCCRSAVSIKYFPESRMFFFKQKRFSFPSKSESRVTREQSAHLHFSRYSCSPGSMCCHSRQTQTNSVETIWYL